MSMLTLFESRYTLKERYGIGNVGKTASMSMLTLFESRYTLKGRYNRSFRLLSSLQSANSLCIAFILQVLKVGRQFAIS